MHKIINLFLLPGDGIGPEVMSEVQNVIDWLSNNRHLKFNITEGLIGGASYDNYGEPLTDETLRKAQSSDAILMGAVGGPKWDNLEFKLKPERGLLRLRKDLDLFANLRPAIVFDALTDASTLKSNLVSGLDIMIVRELTSGVYFGEPRGIKDIGDGNRQGINTQSYTTKEIQRVGRIAFEISEQRTKKLCSVEKSNVMESGLLWREEMQKLQENEYPHIKLDHMYADNCAMQLVRDPKQFDVIVTDNLFGDILSDEASMLTGSLGMLPSASLGSIDSKGHRKALYEPVHGSAPDIAGKNIANPLAMILSFSMLLRYSFDLFTEAKLIEKGVSNILAQNLRTADIFQTGSKLVSTNEMGEALLHELNSLTENI